MFDFQNKCLLFDVTLQASTENRDSTRTNVEVYLLWLMTLFMCTFNGSWESVVIVLGHGVIVKPLTMSTVTNNRDFIGNGFFRPPPPPFPLINKREQSKYARPGGFSTAEHGGFLFDESRRALWRRRRRRCSAYYRHHDIKPLQALECRNTRVHVVQERDGEKERKRERRLG